VLKTRRFCHKIYATNLSDVFKKIEIIRKTHPLINRIVNRRFFNQALFNRTHKTTKHPQVNNYHNLW